MTREDISNISDEALDLEIKKADGLLKPLLKERARRFEERKREEYGYTIGKVFLSEVDEDGEGLWKRYTFVIGEDERVDAFNNLKIFQLEQNLQTSEYFMSARLETPTFSSELRHKTEIPKAEFIKYFLGAINQIFDSYWKFNCYQKQITPPWLTLESKVPDLSSSYNPESLEGRELSIAKNVARELVAIAKKSPCQHSLCAAIIVSEDDQILGRGCNTPPEFDPLVIEEYEKSEILEKCVSESIDPRFKGDPHCCLHAEEVALLKAIRNCAENPELELTGSTLYFLRLDRAGNILPAGHPYCTHCSKLALHLGVKWWVLFHRAEVYGVETFYKYSAKDYNDLSFANSQSKTR